MLSFYDWYADLPVASPQMFGDQTDVPESGRLVGRRLPDDVGLQRAGDPHARTRTGWPRPATAGQKVVVVAPDYADNVKFADEWLPAQPGTDGALAMAMGHVILREFFVDRHGAALRRLREAATPTCRSWSRWTERDGGVRAGQVPDRRRPGRTSRPRRRSRPVVWDEATRRARRSPTARWASATPTPASAGGTSTSARSRPLCPAQGDGEAVEVLLPRFDDRRRRSCCAGACRPRDGRRPAGDHRVRPAARPVRRGPAGPARRVADRLRRRRASRTRRPGRSRSPASRRRSAPGWRGSSPTTPSSSGGRSMILMGAGTNHWFHSDTTYRAMLALTTLTGCQGVNGGGWAHYVGQEKCRPVTGWSHLAFGLDWSRPPRQMIGTAYWYLHTDQWRYDGYDAGALASPLGSGDVRRHAHRRPAGPVGPDGLDADHADVRPQPARRGRRGAGRAARTTRRPRSSRALTDGRLGFAGRTRTRRQNWPRVLTVWRANLLGSQRQGQRVLPAPPARHRRVAAGRRRPRRSSRPRTCAGTTRPPRASSTCC